MKVFFLMLVYVSNFDLFEFSAAILEEDVFSPPELSSKDLLTPESG